MSNDGLPRSNGDSHRSNAPDWDALARYLAGESDAAESESIGRWLEDHPEDRALVERVNEAASVQLPADIDVEAALARVHARMRTDRARPRLTLERKERRSGSWGRRSAIAIGTLAAAAVVAVVLTMERSAHPAAPSAATAQTYATGVGRSDSIVLADGSRIVLGPASRLTVPADYAENRRTVELYGDAFFEVRHDSVHTFAVHVGTATVEDIGTSFTVESDDAATTVAVVTGSVRLRPSDSSASSGVVLAAGDRGFVDQTGKTTAEQHALWAGDTSWTTGRVDLRDATLRRVGAELRRWYGVQLEVSDPFLLDRHVTTTWLPGEPVDQVLKTVETLLGGVRIERHGDSATVSRLGGVGTSR